MRLRLWPVAVAVMAVSAGCAPGLRGRALAGSERARAHARPGARAQFTPPAFDAVFAAAVEQLRLRGHDIAVCEAYRGALTTTPVEVDAPCGGTTCLARDTAHVKLGYRRARVILTREVWDPTLRGWREQSDAPTIEELSREERELVSRMVLGAVPDGRGVEKRDPCVRARCADGNCVAAVATPAP